MPENKSELDLTEVTIELRDGDLYIDGKNCRSFAIMADEEIGRLELEVGPALIVLAEYCGTHCAYHDHENGDEYFLSLFSAMLGKFYASMRAHLALKALIPPKEKLN